MRVTIGERLGLNRRATTEPGQVARSEDGVPSPVEREEAGPVVRISGARSKRDEPCRTPGRYCPGCPCPYCFRRSRELAREHEELGPPRKRGEMLWLHKTAPVLVIEGGPSLSPEEHAAGRRR